MERNKTGNSFFIVMTKNTYRDTHLYGCKGKEQKKCTRALFATLTQGIGKNELECKTEGTIRLLQNDQGEKTYIFSMTT